MQLVFLAAACASIALVAMICFFLFANGLPTIGKIGVSDFLLGQKWRPNNDIYGILPMIMGSLYVTLGACITGVPIGILTAIFMARFCPASVYKFLKPAVELLARQGSDREYGARPLRRAISALVEDPAADLLLEGRMKKGDTLNVVAEDGRVQVRLV